MTISNMVYQNSAGMHRNLWFTSAQFILSWGCLYRTCLHGQLKKAYRLMSACSSPVQLESTCVNANERMFGPRTGLVQLESSCLHTVEGTSTQPIRTALQALHLCYASLREGLRRRYYRRIDGYEAKSSSNRTRASWAPVRYRIFFGLIYNL